MRWKTLMTYSGIPHMSDVQGGDDHSDNNDNNDGQNNKDDKVQNQNNNNNKDDNLDLETDIWQNDNDGGGNNDKDITPPTAEELQTNFNKFVDEINFSEGVDTAKLADELRDGNMEGLHNLIKKTAGSTYKRTIMDANKLVDAKVNAAVDRAVQQATSKVRGSNLVDKMHTQLPFTSKPAIAPIAEAMLRQFTTKGKNPADAIESVKTLFAQLHKTSAKDLGISTPRNRPGNTQFNNSSAPQNEDDDNDPPNWDELLTS